MKTGRDKMDELFSHMRRHKRQSITALVMIVFVAYCLMLVFEVCRPPESYVVLIFFPLAFSAGPYAEGKIFTVALIMLITPYMFAYGFYRHGITALMSIAGVLTWLSIIAWLIVAS